MYYIQAPNALKIVPVCIITKNNLILDTYGHMHGHFFIPFELMFNFFMQGNLYSAGVLFFSLPSFSIFFPVPIS